MVNCRDLGSQSPDGDFFVSGVLIFLARPWGQKSQSPDGDFFVSGQPTVFFTITREESHSPLTGIFLFPGTQVSHTLSSTVESQSPDGDFFVSGKIPCGHGKRS